MRAMSEVRPATREDGPALRALSVATFPNNAEADLVDALLAGDAWVDGLSHVAEAGDGSLVAYAILSRCQIDGAPALALAPCAVHPDVQRQGVGTATIAAALEAARAAGEALVVVARARRVLPAVRVRAGLGARHRARRWTCPTRRGWRSCSTRSAQRPPARSRMPTRSALAHRNTRARVRAPPAGGNKREVLSCCRCSTVSARSHRRATAAGWCRRRRSPSIFRSARCTRSACSSSRWSNTSTPSSRRSR